MPNRASLLIAGRVSEDVVCTVRHSASSTVASQLARCRRSHIDAHRHVVIDVRQRSSSIVLRTHAVHHPSALGSGVREEPTHPILGEENHAHGSSRQDSCLVSRSDRTGCRMADTGDARRCRMTARVQACRMAWHGSYFACSSALQPPRLVSTQHLLTAGVRGDVSRQLRAPEQAGHAPMRQRSV